MKKTLLSVVLLVSISLLVLSAWRHRAYFWPRSYACARALRLVAQECIREGRDPKLLGSPSEPQGVGSEGGMFEWIHEGQPRHVYGVMFSRDGRASVYEGTPGASFFPFIYEH